MSLICEYNCNKIALFSSFCAKHTCKYNKCSELASYLDTCSLHRCITQDCNNSQMKNKKYCSKHSCLLCDKPNYCINHKCKMCSDSNGDNTLFLGGENNYTCCRRDTCTVLTCDKPINGHMYRYCYAYNCKYNMCRNSYNCTREHTNHPPLRRQNYDMSSEFFIKQDIQEELTEKTNKYLFRIIFNYTSF